MTDPTFRPATAADADVVAALWAAAEAVDDTGEHYSVADVEEELGNPLVDLAHDWLLAEVDGELVASSHLAPRAPAEGAVVVTVEGVVRPDRRGRGLASALLPVMLRRARAYVAERGPDLRPLLRAYARSEDEASTSLLEAHGFRAHRWNFVMECDLRATPQASVEPLPGYEITTWESVAAEEIRATHNVAFRDHPGFTPWSEEMWRQYVSGSRAFRPALSLLARDGTGAVAAYVEIAEYDGMQELTGIREAFVAKVGTVPEHRRRGLAAALLGRSLGLAREAGFETAALDVDSENPTGALRVYEQAGFEATRRFTLYELP